MFHLSETFFIENIRCKHRQIMQYLIFELRSRIAPIKSRGRLAEIFIYLRTRILYPARRVVSVPESVYFWRNSDKRIPCFTRQQK